MTIKVVSWRTLLVFVTCTAGVFLASCFIGGRSFDSVLYGWPERFIAYDWMGADGLDHGPVYILWGRLARSLSVHASIGLALTVLYLLVFGSIELIARCCGSGSRNPKEQEP